MKTNDMPKNAGFLEEVWQPSTNPQVIIERDDPECTWCEVYYPEGDIKYESTSIYDSIVLKLTIRRDYDPMLDNMESTAA